MKLSRILIFTQTTILFLFSEARLILAQDIIPLEGFRLWLKTDTGLIVDEMELVSEWQDQSGNGWDASQAVTTAQPMRVMTVYGCRGV